MKWIVLLLCVTSVLKTVFCESIPELSAMVKFLETHPYAKVKYLPGDKLSKPKVLVYEVLKQKNLNGSVQKEATLKKYQPRILFINTTNVEEDLKQRKRRTDYEPKTTKLQTTTNKITIKDNNSKNKSSLYIDTGLNLKTLDLPVGNDKLNKIPFNPEEIALAPKTAKSKARKRHNHKSNKRRKNKTKKRQKSKLVNPLFLNIKVYFDSKVTEERYGKSKRNDAKKDVVILLTDVQKIFNKEPDGANVNVTINLGDVKFLKSGKLGVTKNASMYLQNFCRWQAKKKEKDVYYSILITGFDIMSWSNGKKRLQNAARSYKNGHCNPVYSCLVAEWRPLKLLSFMLAHEIGHSLGIDHDGPHHNNCNPVGFLMSQSFNPDKHPTKWSECSRRSLKQYLASKKSWCVHK